MCDLTRIQKLSEKLANLNLQPESTKQSRIESSETKFRQIEHKFEEIVSFAQKRENLMKEQIIKLEKSAEDEKQTFNESLQEKVKNLSSIESQFTLLIDHEVKVYSKGPKRVRFQNNVTC